VSGLRISETLFLPDDAVTETFALLAKRGAGKSNAAVVMAEQMHSAGLPWVAVDPKGDWWGIRSSGDGKNAGLPVLVLGGQHGDVPLEPTAGRLVADLIVEERLTCVVDVSLMSKADMRRFLADFAERLYTANTDPLHIFAEEAHEYIPQRVTAGDARMVGAWEKLVKWGRTHGIGVTLITQRSASLNKDVLTQVETLIALRTTGPQDQAAIRAWVDEHESGATVVAQLRKLGAGEAFVLSPHWLGLDEPLRIRFDRRRTFDSGATPTAGKKRTEARTLAEVDLAALKEAMAETIEKAKADDPKELRQRIRELEQQLATTSVDRDAWQMSYEETAELLTEARESMAAAAVAVLPPETIKALQSSTGPLLEVLSDIAAKLRKIPGEVSGNHAPTEEIAPTRAGVGRPRNASPGSSTESAVVERTTKQRVVGSSPTRRTDGDPDGLGKTEKRILTVLASHGEQTHASLALLAGYSAKASTISSSASKLRKADLIAPGQPYRITAAGMAYMEGQYEPLPTGPDLLEFWRNRFGSTERAVLDALLDGAASLQEVCDLTGYSPTASTSAWSCCTWSSRSHRTARPPSRR
jgi:hypothetical protein